MNRTHEEEVKRRVYYSSMPGFAIGIFFTISAGIMIYNKNYIVLAGFIPLLITGIIKLWKDGDFKKGGIYIILWFYFIQVPILIYVFHEVLSNGLYWWPIVMGLMYFPGLVSDYVKDIRGE